MSQRHMQVQHTQIKSGIRGVLLAGMLLILMPGISRAAIWQINLDIGFVTELTLDGINPLPLNSSFYLIGSTVNATSTPDSFGDALIADSISGDEVIIAQLQLNWVDGTFDGEHLQTLLNIDVPNNIEYAYIRFFDFQAGFPVVGSNIQWGVTDVIAFAGFGGVVDLFFDDGGVANQTNNFVQIPEPGTMNLLLLAGLGIAYFHFTGFGIAYLRRNRAREKSHGTATAT